MRSKVVSAALLLVIISFGVITAEVLEPLRLRCVWTPPTYGSLPVLYELQVRDINGGLDTMYVVPHVGGATMAEQEYEFLDGQYLREYVARARAMDAEGRYGPWCPWSPPRDFEQEPRDPGS